jgi:hypothetical protein
MRTPVLAIIAVLLASCGSPNTIPTHLQFGSSDTLITTAASRMVSERPRQILGRGFLPTVCSEPSPDVAIAFGKALAAKGSFSEPNGPSISGEGSITETETATQLNGRTAGVLVLRDGLYAACQAYVNGVLGHDAYAIILSQYGNLLVALAGTGTTVQLNYTAQDAAIAALLVTCISEYDPTRLMAVYPDGAPIVNPLLRSPGVCSTLLNRLASGQLIQIPKAPAKGKQATIDNTVGSRAQKKKKDDTSAAAEKISSNEPAEKRLAPPIDRISIVETVQTKPAVVGENSPNGG